MTSGRPSGRAAERIAWWLEQNRCACCDKCLAKELDLSQRQANRAANRLSGVDNFYRDVGICAICGAEKKVTAVV
jgi:hypothetical protein